MPNIDIKITNGAEIRRAFAKAPDLMTDELNKAIKKTLLQVQGETVINVTQRDINVVTGGLRSAAQRPPLFTRLKGVYEVDISYAVFVHQGTRFMRSRPFLKDAVDSQSHDIQKFFTQAADNVLNKIGKDV